jgi:lipopolysaccharide transport system ATP-binding protein
MSSSQPPISTALSCQGLGKMYRIGAAHHAGRTLRDAVAEGIAAPVRRLMNPGTHGARVETIWALRNVSMDIDPGETVGVIGRNGAGKSTLLKVLSRITSPTCGTARVRGTIGTLLEVGTGFHQELTGRENVYMNGAVLGMRRREVVRRFDEIVQFSGVDRFLDTPVKRYSSGMQVRLAFAVAAHLEPDILIVDEVLAVGDYEFQKKCLGRMEVVGRDGRTILFVSHNLDAVRRLCARTVWLEDGGVRMDGPTAVVMDAYLHAMNDVRTGGAISESMHSVNPKRLEVTRVRVETDRGPSVASVMVGERMALTLRYRVKDSAERYRFGIVVRDEQGRVLATLSSADGDNGHLTGDADSDYEVTVWTTNPLMPGSYALEVNVRTPARELVERVEGLWLTVEPVAVQGALPRGGGVLRMDQDWSGPVRCSDVS